MPAGPIPDDFLAAGKEQLHDTFLRPGAPHFPGILQMLGLPTVAQRQPDAGRAQPVLLQRNRVFEQFVYKTHVGIPPPCSSGRVYTTSSATVSSGTRPCARYCPILSINGASDTA